MILKTVFASRFGAGLAMGAAVVFFNGCTESSGIEGPQIGRVPRGFQLEVASRASRPILFERNPVGQRGYFPQGTGDARSSILITEYRGEATPDEIKRAHDYLRSRYPNAQFSSVEKLRIASLPAWGWLATEARGGEVQRLEYVAVIPDEARQRTFTVLFTAAEPQHQNADFLRNTVRSFTPSAPAGWKAKLGLS
jgi:hypothetical protein